MRIRLGGRAAAAAAALLIAAAAAPLPALRAQAPAAAAAAATKIVVTSNKPGSVYKVGDKIVWHLSVTGDGAASVDHISYVLKKNALTEVGKGDLPLKDGAADLETTLTEPGSVLAELTIAPAGKPAVKGAAGALVSPEKIEPAAPPPADFDAFWRDKVKELSAVPMNPVLDKGDGGAAGVDYWKITLDNIRGTKVRGQLARPTAGEKLPALLIVQWAGVYPLAKGWATDRAKQGWLVLNINAHDLPIDEAGDFYAKQAQGPLLSYFAIGNEDRETSYFLRMYLSCYRAMDYLASRPDWDGKTLVVMGTSQGGLQSILTGGFYPKVTALIANVPAGCDQAGPSVGRNPGWPKWWFQTQGKDESKVKATSAYYDVVNFARHVRCPALISTGLIDTTCPSPGVAAAYNQIKAPKELFVMERSDHQGKGGFQDAFFRRADQWLKAIAAGKPAPAEKNGAVLKG